MTEFAIPARLEPVIRKIDPLESKILRELAQTFQVASEHAGSLACKEERERRTAGACFYTGMKHAMETAAWIVSSLDPVGQGLHTLDGDDLEYARSLATGYLSFLNLRAQEERNRITVDKEDVLEPELEDIIT